VSGGEVPYRGAALPLILGRKTGTDCWSSKVRGLWLEAWVGNCHGQCLGPHRWSWPPSLPGWLAIVQPVALAIPVALSSPAEWLPGYSSCGRQSPRHMGPACLVPDVGLLMQCIPASPSSKFWSRSWCGTRYHSQRGMWDSVTIIPA
jgi:hypothetical protein